MKYKLALVDESGSTVESVDLLMPDECDHQDGHVCADTFCAQFEIIEWSMTHLTGLVGGGE